MIEAFSRLEDYESLEKIIIEIPDNTPILMTLGERF